MIPYAQGAATPGRRKTETLRLLEKHIQEACCQILEFDGWRRIRMEATYSEKKRKGVGEPGMADDLFIRYEYQPCSGETCSGERCFPRDKGKALVMFIEWKRLVPQPTRVIEKGRPKQRWPRSTQAAVHQKAWHAIERKRGALTLIAGEDFIASIDGFRDWYRESGLMRNGKAAGG